MKGVQKVIVGGWYQRTTLHLTEVYAFMKNANTRLKLSKAKLKSFQKRLDLKSVERNAGKLEWVEALTNSGIKIRYYEDGLYVLEESSMEVMKTAKKIRGYFENKFQPAISYLFSLGAPTPKILSNIKQEPPTIIGRIDRKHKTFSVGRSFGKIYSSYSSKNNSVYKTKDFIFVVTSNPSEDNLDKLIGMQIFFREFKDQLHRYLNIHRKIWEYISDIKDMEGIKGKEISFYRTRLDQYKKTISLIRDRINQMGDYARTRASLAKFSKIEEDLLLLFQYKFEDLFNTLNYIKEIWNMTNEYVNSAIQVLNETAAKAGQAGIRSIQILASIGVVSGVLGYLTRESYPTLSPVGAISLIILGVIGFGVDFFLKHKAKNKKYRLKFSKRAVDI